MKVRIQRNTDNTTTLLALIAACNNRTPVTISYMKDERDEATNRPTGRKIETVRTIEIRSFFTAKGDPKKGNAGAIMIRAMDRQAAVTDAAEAAEAAANGAAPTSEPQPGVRDRWHLSNIVSFTIHHGGRYMVDVPEETADHDTTRAAAAYTARVTASTTAELIDLAMWADLDTDSDAPAVTDPADMDPGTAHRDAALIGIEMILAAA